LKFEGTLGPEAFGTMQQWIQLEEPLPDPNKPIASLSDQRPPLAWQITPLN
jgi:hypothetical protein